MPRCGSWFAAVSTVPSALDLSAAEDAASAAFMRTADEAARPISACRLSSGVVGGRVALERDPSIALARLTSRPREVSDMPRNMFVALPARRTANEYIELGVRG